MKKVLLSILLIGAAFTFQSCSDDDNEIFDDAAAVRIDKAVAEAKALLASSPNGWMMQYYTGEQYTGGGFTMLVKFDGSKAHASSDISDDENLVATSSYDVIKDQGPVLTFNTYNEVLHFLAQPYQGQVDGVQGDYEFVIQQMTDDAIYLKGKKWGNKFVMTRIPETVNWADYLNELKKTDEATAFTYLVEKSGAVVDTLIIYRDEHNALMASQTETVPYYYVPGGIEFHETMTAKDGTSFSSIKLVDVATSKYTDAAGTVDLVKCTDEGFNMDISRLVGEWSVKYTNIGRGKSTNKLVFEGYDEYIGKKSHTILMGTLSYDGQARAEYGPDSPLEDAAGDYTLFMIYDVRTGKFMLSNYSTSADPTEKNDILYFVGARIDNEGYFGFGNVELKYSEETGNLTVAGPYNGFAYLNTYIDEEGDSGLGLRFYGLDITELTRVK